jgi:hypothetical protein
MDITIEPNSRSGEQEQNTLYSTNGDGIEPPGPQHGRHRRIVDGASTNKQPVLVKRCVVVPAKPRIGLWASDAAFIR